jgi:hypothetical protein
MRNWCSEWCRKNIFNINGVVDGVEKNIIGVVKARYKQDNIVTISRKKKDVFFLFFYVKIQARGD